MKYRITFCLLAATTLLHAEPPVSTAPERAAFQVDASSPAGALPKFWRSTGLTPAANLRHSHNMTMVKMIAAIPHDGMEFIRIHHMLQLPVITEWENDDVGGTPTAVDFTDFDRIVDDLVKHDYKFIFEFMGWPKMAGVKDGWGLKEWKPDFGQEKDTLAWAAFIRLVVAHLVDRHGRDAIAEWYFETWNEPDVGSEIHGNNQGAWPQGKAFKDSDDPAENKYLRQFLNYAYASQAGTKAVDPAFRFGGPGTAHAPPTVMIEGFLKPNPLLGRVVPLDFISVHHKNPVTEMVDDTIEDLEMIAERFPMHKTTPFLNDEGDPLVGWKKDLDWRPTAAYPAYCAHQIDQHARRILDAYPETPFEILSNDNAFVSGSWLHRTQVIRFHRKGVGALHVKKPVYNGNVMFSLLGAQRVATSGDNDIKDGLGLVATREEGQVAVLLYHDDWRRIPSPMRSTVDLSIQGLPFTSGSFIHYRIDEDHTNPYALHSSNDAPTDRDRIRKLLAAMELEHMAFEPEATFEGGRFSTTVEMPGNSVSLLVFTAKPEDGPDTSPDVLELEHFTTTDGSSMTAVYWKTLPDKTLKTYEVLYSPTGDAPWRKVNRANNLTGVVMHHHDEEIKAPKPEHYRIVAVDHWGRRSEETRTPRLP